MAITSINLGKIKFNWKGPWGLGVTYVKDDVVRYSGSSYVVVTGHVSATSWATNSSKFELMAEGTTPTTTEGDLIVRGVSADERLAIGDPGQVLTVSTGGIPVWQENGVLNKIYYVAPTGNDSNSGQSWGTAFATIKHACSVAVGPATIRVASGSFNEQLPITVPSFVAVIGDNQRTTIVGPASGYEQQTMWKLGDGALLNKMAFIGLTGYVPYAPDDTNIELATIGGVYVAFDPLVPIATKSPYVIECSAKSSGGIGALIDGSVHATGIKSMVFHGFTVILDNGVGYWVKDTGKSEIVSCFTYYCHIGYATTGGGKIRALNGNNSYGTYGALSSGYNQGESTINGTIYGNMLTWTNGTLVSTFEEGDTITGADSLTTGTVLNVQPGTSRIYYKKLTGTGFIAGESISNGTGASMTVAVGGVTGQTGVILVVTGLSAEPKPGGSVSITGDSISYVVQSSSGWTNSGSSVVLVLAAEKAAYSVDGTNMKLRYDYSNIRLTGHDFLSIGTGGVASTNYPGVPTQASSQGNEVVELFPGRVFYVSTDQDGNFRVGEYFKVDQATGRATLNASAFDLSGLTSLRLGSIGAQLGALVNEFSTDDTLSGNSNVAVPTERAVRQYFSHVATNVLPSITNSLTLGTSSYLWDKVYANKLVGPSTLIIDPAAEGDNTGTVQIKGNLQVDGTTTTINSTTLTVDDKNIVLGDGAANDAAADGSGITVYSGDGNKTFNWVNATDAFTANQNINVASTFGYLVDGTSVLNATTLGSNVTGSSLTSVGTLSSLTVSGTVNANGTSGLVTSQVGTVGLFNTNATGLNIGGAATAVSIGAATGTTTINNPTVTFGSATAVNINGASPGIVTSSTGTAAVFNTNALTGNLFGAATTIAIGASTGTTTINNATVTLANATVLNLNGASPGIVTSSTGTAAVFNTNALTGNLFGAATTIAIGASTGTTTVYNSVGIGSANSAYPLQITKDASSATNPAITISPTTGTNASLIYMNNSGNGGFNVGRSNSAGGGSGTTLTAYDSFVWNTGSQALKFGTNNTLAMTIGTDQTLSFAKSIAFAGATTYLSSVFTNSAEVATVSATAATGTIAFYVTTQSVLYYTSNASANWTINITGASTPVTLNTLLSTGQSITVTHLVTQGTTAYYNSSVQVDGTTSGVTTKWQGSAPVQGNASGIDVYTYSIIKTGSAAFTVLAAQSRFS
jgi:hypothetical protein